MKNRLMKLLEAKQEQRNNLNKALIESDNKEERAAIGETLSALANEIAEVEALIADADKPADEPAAEEGRKVVLGAMEQRSATDNVEARAKAFAETGRMVIDNAEARSVLVSSGDIATPTEVSGINDPVGGRVSSIVDLVKITNASGMGAYKVAYIDTDATAATQTEGGAYNAGEPTFGYVEIVPQTEAVLSYISKQVTKQTPLNYQQKVNESALVALRKRAAKIITDKLVASTLNTKITTALNETTLRKVAFSYGGDDGIVGAATLFINKADLVALGDVRGSDKKAVYEITPDANNPSTGVIRDGGLAVPYCLDSNLASGTLVYGQAKAFELALFSNYEVRVSEDFAFDKGLLAIRGDVELGGDVTVKGGFVVATNA